MIGGKAERVAPVSSTGAVSRRATARDLAAMGYPKKHRGRRKVGSRRRRMRHKRRHQH
jgi:hypothetical protein